MVSKPCVYSASTLLTEARIDKLSSKGGARPLFVRGTRLTGFGLKVTPADAKWSAAGAGRRPIVENGALAYRLRWTSFERSPRAFAPTRHRRNTNWGCVVVSAPGGRGPALTVCITACMPQT